MTAVGEGLRSILSDAGCQAGQHIVLHASFRAVRSAFPDLTIDDLIGTLQSLVGSEGSLLIPTFTYCFKTKSGPQMRFSRPVTPSKVGAVSEAFRSMEGVVRTSSPTHSFGLWGRAAREISPSNNPLQPLGDGSPMEWLDDQSATAILLLGVDFAALSFVHYLEGIAPVPWVDIWPWDHLGVLPVGVSEEGEFPLQHVPGCSRGFVHLERDLARRQVLRPVVRGMLKALLMPVERLRTEALVLARSEPERLLCTVGSCPACDTRRSSVQRRP